jgi:hypothetical protein
MTDTAQKRASAMLVGLPFRPPLLVPDADLDDSDRAQVGYLYFGIDYAGGGPVDATGVEWLINARRRGSR